MTDFAPPKLFGCRAVAAAGLMVVALASCASAPSTDLGVLQGGWWEHCNDPSAAFVIDGQHVYGDFEGRYDVTLQRNILTFHSSSNVFRYRLISHGDGRLILRPLDSGDPDWVLRLCRDELSPTADG